MSFLPIRRYRHHADPFDRYFGDQSDFFDPWNDFDMLPTTLSTRHNGFRWIHQPRHSSSSHLTESSSNKISRSSDEKFRVEINVAGFNPDSVKTNVQGHKVKIEAKQEEKDKDGNLNSREICKTYELPENADVNHLVSYITPNNMLVVEVPIEKSHVEKQLPHSNDQHEALAQFGQQRDPHFDYSRFVSESNFKPKILEKNNHKQLQMNLEMKNYKPDEIKVSVKNDQLIVQGEHSQQDQNSVGRSYFYKSIVLPPGTQIDQLRSHLNEDGHLNIEAPFVEQTKVIEIDHK